jgi:hypothetical protein
MRKPKTLSHAIALALNPYPEPQVLVAMYTALQQHSDNKTNNTTGIREPSGGSQLPSSTPAPGDRGDADSDGDAAEKEQDTEAATDGDAGESMKGLLRLRVLDVLEAYQRHLPEALADANFSPAKLFSVDPRLDSPPLQARAFFL